MKYQGLIFDMDGTLTVPAIDFVTIRKELGISSGDDLVPIIESWPEERRRAAWRLIEKHEDEARGRTQLQPGVNAALNKFSRAGLKLAILTRNSRAGVEVLLKMIEADFEVIMTREERYIKPDPRAVLNITEQWQLPVEQTLVIGDYIHDIICARDAGAKSCFFANPGFVSYADAADYTVGSFAELETLVLH